MNLPQRSSSPLRCGLLSTRRCSFDFELFGKNRPPPRLVSEVNVYSSPSLSPWGTDTGRRSPLPPDPQNPPVRSVSGTVVRSTCADLASRQTSPIRGFTADFNGRVSCFTPHTEAPCFATEWRHQACVAEESKIQVTDPI